jgi:hypothetical protein
VAILRRVALGAAASVLAVGAVLAPATAPVVRAAADGLELRTAATYTIVPNRHLVRVVLDITARNNKPNVTSGGIVTKYFYEGARVAIQPGAANVRATAAGADLTATTKPADGYAILEVRFRASLFYHQTTTVRVTFDLPGGAPRSTSDIRVGSAFATFAAWAFGDAGSVRVIVPAGFEAEVTGSPATKSTSGGATVYRATGITDIAAWYLLVNADREAALTQARIDLTGGEHVVIRAWPEDKAWRSRVTDLLTRGLPELDALIGLPWPVAGDLAVFEVHTPLLEGYAGVFLEGADKIEISEDLDDLTIVHEASHAWFNSNLFAGRWIAEGLANTYAAKVLEGIGLAGGTPNPVSPTDRFAVRLVDWTHPGRITDDATDARERYGYDAAWTVIAAIADEVGDAGMRDVFAAANAHAIAYVGSGSAETVGGPNDWRRFLDLLDEAGHSTSADAAFRRWVVTDAEAAVLDERATARDAYRELVERGAGWLPPLAVRAPLGAWDFAAARARIGDATAILARRDAIAAMAASLGVRPPAALQRAYETAQASFDEANRIADEEAAALHALAEAEVAVAAPRAPLVTLGQLGTSPEAALADARAAFDAGAPEAPASAAAVTALIDGAVAIGRERAVAGIGAVLVLLVVVLALTIVLARRRRARPAMAHRSAADRDPDAAAPYATLADQPSRPPDRGDAE